MLDGMSILSLIVCIALWICACTSWIFGFLNDDNRGANIAILFIGIAAILVGIYYLRKHESRWQYIRSIVLIVCASVIWFLAFAELCQSQPVNAGWHWTMLIFSITGIFLGNPTGLWAAKPPSSDD